MWRLILALGIAALVSAQPTLTITSGARPSGSTVNDNTVIFTFTISEPGTTFNEGSIATRVNCAGGVFTGTPGGIVFQLSCPGFPGQVREIGVGVSQAAFTDSSGVFNSPGVSYYFLVNDLKAPTASISHVRSFESCGIINANDFSNRNPLEFVFTTSEPVSGFTSSDISATNCNDMGFRQASTNTYIVSCDTDGFDHVDVTVGVNAGEFSDLAGNGLASTVSRTITSDTVSPTLQISSQGHLPFDTVTDDPIVFTFSISEQSDFNRNDITTLEHCLNPDFDGSGNEFTLSCDRNPGELVAVGVGRNDIIDCSGNKNTVGVTYFGFFSELPASPSPSPSFLAPGQVRPSRSPSRTPTMSPSPSPSNFCTSHNYVGPFDDSFLSRCTVDDCFEFSNLNDALLACSNIQYCGGVTETTWSEDDFGHTIGTPIYQTRLGSLLVDSTDGEKSWVRLGCNDTITVEEPSGTIDDPGLQTYCYDGPFADTYLPECIDEFCTSFPTMALAQAYCNSVDECAGITETTWGPADGSIPFQPRLFPILTESPYGENSYLRRVCAL